MSKQIEDPFRRCRQHRTVNSQRGHEVPGDYETVILGIPDPRYRRGVDDLGLLPGKD